MTDHDAVVLLCTEGFVDVLTLGRQNRPDPYAAHVPPSPWITRLPDAWRIEVRGRIDARGREVTPLDVEGAIARLRALPVTPRAVAIALFSAQVSAVHERALGEAVRQAFPQARVAMSHEVAARAGEFERTVATLGVLGVSVGAVVGVAVDAQAGDTDRTAPTDTDSLATFTLALESLADRMQAHLVEHAVSSVVREAMDCAAAVFLPDGRLVAQARTLPLLLGSLEPAVAGILQVFPVDTMADGDGYLSNDPWSGGTHLPDLVLLRPVVMDGAVRALVACVLHHQDVGGIAPGSVPTHATSVLQEGLRLPPVKIAANDALDATWLRLLRANSRMPDNLEGDLRAQWAACVKGAGELTAFIAGQDASRGGAVASARRSELAHAVGAFTAHCKSALHRSEHAVRAALLAAPDGDYTFTDALDGDGITGDAVPLVVRILKRGDTATIDLCDCAPQTAGPVNASRGAVWAAISYFARMLAPDAPSNGGGTRALTVRTRPGTIVDPQFPAAINARTNLVKLLANALLGAWAQARPQAMPAPNAAEAVVLSLSGTDGDGRRWVFTEIIASAAGGAPWGPGGSGVSTDVGNARSTPAEVIEAQAPIRVERVARRRGSGGRGLHAGGDGVVRAYRLLEGEGAISYRGERHAIAPQGAAGGEPGACAAAHIERADGTIEPLPAKARANWRAGDRLVIETAGAGGWGAPEAGGGSTPEDGDIEGSQKPRTIQASFRSEP